MDNSISVSVRVRPLTGAETARLQAQTTSNSIFQTGASLSAGSSSSAAGSTLNGFRSPNGVIRRILKVVDERLLVFDPENPLVGEQKALLPHLKKVKDVRFCFDRVYDEPTTQQEVFEGSASSLLDAAFAGYNATVFAYGATGCGKTHTISGTPEDPGIIFRLMQSVFDRIEAKKMDTTVEVTVSYLEIYNETIRDLLVETQGKPLNLREADQRVMVPGLSEHTPQSAEEVLSLINAGNLNRTTGSTDANATSSRSHAVLSVNLKMRARTADISESYSLATLSVIDLAGSERACVTNNKGARLHEGANINRSLLTLGNCIKALCDPKAKMHVPFRDSKLTRLLKHSLTGNCRTQLIVCVSPSSQHYDETYNTLQYANKAKDIQTKVQRNVISVDRHVSQYVRLIHELRQEIEERKRDDSSRDAKVKAQDKREREQAEQQATAAALQLGIHKNSVVGRISVASSSHSQLESVEALHRSLLQWQQAIFQDQPMTSESEHLCAATVDTLLRDLSTHVQQLRPATADLAEARGYFTSQVRQARQRIRHQEALSSFDRDCQVMQLELDVSAASAREQGRMSAFSMQLRAFGVVSDVRARLAGQNNADSDRAETASKHFFDSFGQFNTLPSFSTSVPASAGLSLFPAPSAVASSSRLSSVSVPPLQPAPVLEKASRRPAGGMHVPGSSPQRKKQKKSVIWKDEAGEGLDLAEAERSAENISTAQASTLASAVETPMAAAAGASTDTSSSAAPLPVPRTTMQPAPLPQAPRLSSATALKTKGSSTRMKTGFLGRSRLSVIKDEEGSPAAGPSSRPSSAAGNTSLTRPRSATSSADTSTDSINSSFNNSTVQHTRSSMLKAAHGRRMSTVSKNNRRSSIGPIKGLKPSRRASQALQAGAENRSPGVSGNQVASGPSKVTSSSTTRAPGRVSLAPDRATPS